MIAAFLLVALALMLRFPQESVGAARTALAVWGLDVVPSLFPYMVFCRVLASRLRARGVSASLAAPLLGVLGGSPSGAAVISAYAGAGRLSGRMLRALAALTGTVSPTFLLSTVALWAKDARLGRLLLASNLVGAVIAMVFAACAGKDGERFPIAKTPCEESPGEAITQSVQAILGVGGCIVFYSVLSSLPGTILPGEKGVGFALLHAALEVSGGLHALLGAPLEPYARAVLCAAATGFSGLSILTQNLIFLRPLGLTLPRLTGFGLLRAAGASAAMALLYPLLG